MITIESAKTHEADALSRLARQCFLETFEGTTSKQDLDAYLSEAFFEDKQMQEMADPNAAIFIARNEHDLIGYIHLISNSSDPSVSDGPSIEIRRLYVLSAWHHQRLGRLLMETGLKFAKDNGFSIAWLGVWEHNHKAQNFYRKFDFKSVGSHAFFLGQDEQTDLIMQKTIIA